MLDNNVSTEFERLKDMLNILQKRVKYGVATKTAVSICETIFNDRVLATKLTNIKLIQMVKNDESTEITMTISLNAAIECPHETVILEAGKPATCTEDGIKDKYVCEGCGAAFFDAARTQVWYDVIATIPKGHLVIRHDATPCSEGKDGNTVYFECRREECGKLFADTACSS